MTKYVAFDTETTLIGKDAIIPTLICASFYTLGVKGYEVIHWSPKEELSERFRRLLIDPDMHLILHNAAFDLAVVAQYDWSLMPLIWEALRAGRIHDTMIREKLINLTTSGSIDIIEQYGLKTNVRYSLAELVKLYLQIDISEEKDADDSVRTNFESVMYMPMDTWPKEYIEYAGMDAQYTGMIFLEQERRRGEVKDITGYDPFVKESFVVNTALALQFMTAQGNLLDTEKVKQVTEEFINLYNDEALVWPLVHSAWIQLEAKRTPQLKGDAFIAYCRTTWEEVNDKKYWDNTGMVIPAVPPMPYAKGTKDHRPECKTPKTCDCPVKMKNAVPESGSDTNLHAYVWEAARRNPAIEVWLSEGIKDKLKTAGYDIPHPIPRDVLEANETVPMVDLKDDKKPVRMSLKVDKEWLATFAQLDPVLSIYDERHKIQKIVTSYLPCLYWADGYKTGCPLVLPGQTDKFEGKSPAERVHAQYAPLKETGRTSSYAAKKGQGNKAVVLYPSWNGQQVDPRIRGCVIAEKGNVICSIDYSAMELGTAAQIAYNLLGYEGVLMKLINEGKDTHSYLGAQIAVALDPEFTRAWGLSAEDPMKSYDLFKGVSKEKAECDSPVFRDIFQTCYVGKKWGDKVVTMEDCTMAAYYKHFRTFGKPTGLGFWGGLGEPTFMALAKASYGIAVDLETAQTLRTIWRTYIPEGQEYLNHVNKYMVDPLAAPDIVEDEDGKSRKRQFYCYDTPLGMHRAKCTYTAAANGCALQSPSAEGALGAVIEIMRECTVGSLAGYVFPSLFIHDEILSEVVYDEHTTERVNVLQRIMKENMEKITPNVRAGTEACLMRRWDKRAEPKFRDGKLIPWEDEV
jgi:hypothetical protein